MARAAVLDTFARYRIIGNDLGPRHRQGSRATTCAL
jgi:hypothetical protein